MRPGSRPGSRPGKGGGRRNAETALGRYLDDFLRPRQGTVRTMPTAEGEKPTVAMIARRLDLDPANLGGKISGLKPFPNVDEMLSVIHSLKADPATAIPLWLADIMGCKPATVARMVREYYKNNAWDLPNGRKS